MKNAAIRKLFLRPMGNGVTDGTLSWISNALSKTFDLEVGVLDTIPVPSDAFNIDRQQYMSYLLIMEAARKGAPGLILAITDQDMYAADLSFVFGEADRQSGTAVMSTARLKREFYGGKADDELLYERAVKEAVHEVGHLIGLPHCEIPECVMRYSLTIMHVDDKVSTLCERCHTRLDFLRKTAEE